MDKLKAYLLLTIAASNILVGFFVFLRNYKKTVNLLFFLVVSSMAAWVIGIAGFLLSLEYTVAMKWGIFYYIAPIFIGVFLLAYAINFPNYNKFPKKLMLIGLFGGLLVVMLLSGTGFLANSIIYHSWGKEILLDKADYLVYALFLLVTYLSTLFIMYRKSRTEKGIYAKQAKLFFWGFLLTFFVGVGFNLVLPFFGNYKLIWIGPISPAIFMTAIAYSIIKHKMFDFRLIVFRSVGYVLSIGILVTIFGVISSLAVSRFFINNNSTTLPILLNTALFVGAVLTYSPLKKYFDKITNKYFFRDAYDPQEFLDQLNKNIVSNIEIGILLRHTTQIIQDNLKCSYCTFVVHETDNEPMRLVGNTKSDITQSELISIRDEVSLMKDKVIQRELLDDSNKNLKKIFNARDIEFLVHLKASSYGSDQTIAYMLFGPKNSGNLYSSADFKIMDIISDELVIAIQNALRFEEIQEFNVTLQKKVNDATGKLKRTNEKLKALDETKDEFISMASHQLRTPLTSVKGYLSMVLEGDAGEINENQRKLLDQAFVSSQRMVYLISDLLNVSRLRTGKFVIDAHPCNLADVVESEIAQLREQAKNKNQTLEFDKPTDFPVLLLDETKIRQVIMNFSDNALFYTPSGGKIRIELKEDKSHIYFMVKDNGIGVPKEEQKHMFTKFYRAKNARNARPDGTGLGLFMAKKVITAQGGNVLFESIEGKGSTFGFSFNKKHLAESADTDQEEATTNQ